MNALLLALAGYTWQVTTVATGGEEFDTPYIVTNQAGMPRIAWTTQSNQVWYGYWDGSAWQTGFVDAGSYSPVLRLDSLEYPHISYLALTPMRLKYARWDGAAWQITNQVAPIDGGSMGSSTTGADMTAGSRSMVIFPEMGTDTIHFAEYDGAVWNVDYIDVLGGQPWGNSVDIASDTTPHVAYWDVVTGWLLHASRSGAVWVRDTVGPYEGIMGYSLALLNDTPRIASGYGTVRLHEWNGASWTTQSVESGSRFYPSLQYNALGNPTLTYVSYGSPRAVYFAEWNGASWDFDTIQTNLSSAVHVSHWIAPDGCIHAVYGYSSIGYVQYASTCAPVGVGGEEAALPSVQTPLTLFPLPGGLRIVATHPVNISVYDVSGRLVRSLLVEREAKVALKPGVYFVRPEGGQALKAVVR